MVCGLNQKDKEFNEDKIREQLVSTFFSEAEADWLIENDPELAERAACENGRTSALFHALQKAGEGAGTWEKEEKEECSEQAEYIPGTDWNIEEMTDTEAMDFLQEQAVVLGITNPPLKRAIVMATDAYKKTVWNDVKGEILPKDGQLVLCDGTRGVWLYVYHERDGEPVGFFRLGDHLSSFGTFDDTVAVWKEI